MCVLIWPGRYLDDVYFSNKTSKLFLEPQNSLEEHDERKEKQRSRGKRAEGPPKDPFGREKGPQGTKRDTSTRIDPAAFGARWPVGVL